MDGARRLWKLAQREPQVLRLRLERKALQTSLRMTIHPNFAQDDNSFVVRGNSLERWGVVA
jgi:hypothetical protein